jgi:ATPase subunit of ABC transporter with duplicated ATPase domains
MAAQESEKRDEAITIQIPAGPHLGTLVVEADNVSKCYGDRVLFEGMTFRLPPGGIVGVIGPNGAGKTTLARMIVGQEKPTSGVLRVGESVVVSYVDQSREALDAENTVYQEISGGKEHVELGKRKVPSRAYVSWFNFKGPDQEKKVGKLSGGERNRVHLAKLLKSGGNLMLLDEPTNDLDVDTLRALEDAIVNFAGCAVVISHDRWFLDRVATHILAFEGDSTVVWCDGNYQAYEHQRHERLGSDADQPHRTKYKSLTR